MKEGRFLVKLAILFFLLFQYSVHAIGQTSLVNSQGDPVPEEVNVVDYCVDLNKAIAYAQQVQSFNGHRAPPPRTIFALQAGIKRGSKEWNEAVQAMADQKCYRHARDATSPAQPIRIAALVLIHDGYDPSLGVLIEIWEARVNFNPLRPNWQNGHYILNFLKVQWNESMAAMGPLIIEDGVPQEIAEAISNSDSEPSVSAAITESVSK